MQVGVMIMFVSVLSRWIIRLIHKPNYIVSSSLIYVFVGGMVEWRNGLWNGGMAYGMAE